MNIPILSLVLTFASVTLPPPNFAAYNAQRARALALSADTVVLKGEMQPARAGILVDDREWMARFAEALGRSDFSREDHVLGGGWETAYFYRDGNQVLSVATISGHQLRVYSQKGGGDFIVSEKQWEVIDHLIREKMKPDRASDRDPGSNTPGTRPR